MKKVIYKSSGCEYSSVRRGTACCAQDQKLFLCWAQHAVPLRTDYSTSRMNECGNGILEMLLSVPLALLLMFVGIDLGLSNLDKAMISDAVRETAHNQLVSRVSSSGNSVYQVQANGIYINQELVNTLAQSLADRLAEVVTERRVNLGHADPAEQVKAQVTPIRISVDPRDGRILGYTKMPSLNSQSGNAELVLGPLAKVISDDEYLNLQLGASTTLSTFALPAPNYSDSNSLYLNESLAFLISVEAISPSINPLFLQQVLNSSLGIKIQDLHVIRS